MAEQSSEDKKMDISSLPRGAIGIKGLPISRNTRLPSIRTPRDLTLGTPSKRTFVPKIPPRREKKSSTLEKPDNEKEVVIKPERKNIFSQNEKGRGRHRGKANIIQTEGSIFAEGIAENVLARKERICDSYQRSDYVVAAKNISYKKEIQSDKDVSGISRKMDELFTDNGIDHTDDEVTNIYQPTIFPPDFLAKKEAKKEVLQDKDAFESVTNFNQNIAAEMGFDINRVAKFIKKEKGSEVERKKKPVAVSTEGCENEIISLLNKEVPQLVLLQFPECVAVPQKMDDSQTEPNNRGQSVTNPPKDDKNSKSTSISSFPEGCVGKLQVFKSGKTRLLLGCINFDLESINALKSKHEVVSIRTDSNTGDLSVLGYIEHKLKFAPDVDSLLS